MHRIPILHTVTSVLEKWTANAFGLNKKFYYIFHSFSDKGTIRKRVFTSVSSDFLCSYLMFNALFVANELILFDLSPLRGPNGYSGPPFHCRAADYTGVA